MSKIFNKLKREKILIFAFILILLKSLVWLYIFPPFQTPDEIAHFAYVQFIAEKDRLPVQGETIESRELYESLTILESGRIIFQPTEKINYSSEDLDRKKNELNELNTPENRKDFNGDVKSVNTPPLYYYMGSLFYKYSYDSDILIRIFYLKVFSIILSLFCFIFIYKASIIIFKDKLASSLFALALLFQPMYSMLAIAVNPENLSYALFAVFFYFIVRIIRDKKLDFPNILYFGVLTSLFFLTKQYGIVLFFAFLVLVSLSYKWGNSLKKIILGISLYSIVVLSLPLWWYIKYSEGQVNSLNANIFSLKEYSFNIFSKFQFILNGYWGFFGWLDTPLDYTRFYPIFLLLFLLTIIGLPFAIKKAKKEEKIRLIVFSSIVVFAISFLIVLDYKISTKELGFLQGRYFLLTLPINTYLSIAVLDMLFKYKYRDIIIYALFSLMVLFNLVSIYYYIIPRYNVFI